MAQTEMRIVDGKVIRFYDSSNTNNGTLGLLSDTFTFDKDMDITGNITLSGTVDSRDINTDGTKLDTIATNADVSPVASVFTRAGAVVSAIGDYTKEQITGLKITNDPTFAGLHLNGDLDLVNHIMFMSGLGFIQVADSNKYIQVFTGSLTTGIYWNATNNAYEFHSAGSPKFSIDLDTAIISHINHDFSAGIDVTGGSTFSSSGGGNIVDLFDTGATSDTDTFVFLHFSGFTTNSGYIGYGSPSNTYLYVNNLIGSVYLDGTTIESNANHNFADGIDVTGGTLTTNSYVQFYNATDVSERLTFNGDADGLFTIYNIDETGSVYQDINIGHSVSGSAGSLFYDANLGNWGIGDATPTYGLDVNGTFRAVGNADFSAGIDITAGLSTFVGTTGTTPAIIVTQSVSGDPYSQIKVTGSTIGGIELDSTSQSHVRFSLAGVLKYQWRFHLSDQIELYSFISSETKLHFDDSTDIWSLTGNLDVSAGIDVTGNITVTGTVDGVDIADRDHAPTVAGDLNHNDLANINAGTSYEHITQTQKDNLHSIYVLTKANVDALAITTVGALSVGSITTGFTAIGDSFISSSSTWNGKQDALTFGIANTNSVIINHASVVDNDFAKFTASGLEGRSYSETLGDIGAQASLTFGIANTNSLVVDDAAASDNDYAKFTASGLEGVPYATVLSDIGAQASLTFGIANTNSVIINSADVASGEYGRFTASGLESRTIGEIKSDLSLTATDVGLGNVDNVADASQTSLGTVTIGDIDNIANYSTRASLGLDTSDSVTFGDLSTGGDLYLSTVSSRISLGTAILSRAVLDLKPTITDTASNNFGLIMDTTLSGAAPTDHHNIYSATTFNGTTLANHYGIRIKDPTGSGAITTNFGLYIDNQTKGGTDYAIYSAGGQNLFVGNADFSAGIDVTGDITGTTKANINAPTGTAGDVNTGSDGVYSYRDDDATRYVRFDTKGTYNDLLSTIQKLVINYSGGQDVTFHEGTSTADVYFYGDNVFVNSGNLLMDGTTTDDERLKLPYLTALPTSADNGSMWMESDGLHIYSGGAEATLGTGAVTSVFGRGGVVVAVDGDYSQSLITGLKVTDIPTFAGMKVLDTSTDHVGTWIQNNDAAAGMELETQSATAVGEAIFNIGVNTNRLITEVGSNPAGAWMRIDTRAGSEGIQWYWEAAASDTENVIFALDDSGNMGIGTNDIEAWTTYYAMEFGGGGAIMSSKTLPTISFSNNAYHDGAWNYKTTAAATLFESYSGAFYFLTAPSGTIDTAPSWTQRLVIGNTGDVTISGTILQATWQGDIIDTAYLDKSLTSMTQVQMTSALSRTKFQVWNDANWGIGMTNGISYGYMGSDTSGSGTTEYGMIFQTQSSANRGFWWGNEGHALTAGAMSLTHEGELYVETIVNTGDLTVRGTSTTIGTVTSGIWNGTAIASAYLDSDTAHLTTTQTFSGTKTFSANTTFSTGIQTDTITAETDTDHAILMDAATNQIHIKPSDTSTNNYLIIQSSSTGETSPKIMPDTAARGWVGDSTLYFARMYSDRYFYKTTSTLISFDTYDDLAILEAVDILRDEQGNPVKNEDGHVLEDPRTYPDFVKAKKTVNDIEVVDPDFFEKGSVTSFLKGCIKQLNKREKEHYQEMLLLTDEINNLKEEMNILKNS